MSRRRYAKQSYPGQAQATSPFNTTPQIGATTGTVPMMGVPRTTTGAPVGVPLMGGVPGGSVGIGAVGVGGGIGTTPVPLGMGTHTTTTTTTTTPTIMTNNTVSPPVMGSTTPISTFSTFTPSNTINSTPMHPPPTSLSRGEDDDWKTGFHGTPTSVENITPPPIGGITETITPSTDTTIGTTSSSSSTHGSSSSGFNLFTPKDTISTISATTGPPPVGPPPTSTTTSSPIGPPPTSYSGTATSTTHNIGLPNTQTVSGGSVTTPPPPTTTTTTTTTMSPTTNTAGGTPMSVGGVTAGLEGIHIGQGGGEGGGITTGVTNTTPPTSYTTPIAAATTYTPPQATMATIGRGGRAQATPSSVSSILPPSPSAQCPPKFLRMTVNAIPTNNGIATKAGIPLGCVLHPLAPTKKDEIPVVNFKKTLGLKDIIRCRKCRSYINPFVQFIDGGSRWRCNICSYPNDAPPAYRAPLDGNGQRHDLHLRPELTHGCVEFIAPEQYTVRAPQPPSYLFVIDVSYYSLSSGMLHATVEAIRISLDTLPGDSRTQVGFITFDSAIHFYNLRSGLSQPHMMVVTDIAHLFLPLADDLLVNLADSRDVVENLLNLLPKIHENNQNIESAMGSALKAAWNVMKPVGGRIVLFQTKLPSIKPGLLSNRENPKLLGTDKESTLLRPQINFYKDFALDCSRQQISVDTFLFSPQYTDVATISSLSQFTGGQLFYYPAFSALKDGEKFLKDATDLLSRETAFEAVMRVRVSKGLSVQAHFGNFFIRSSDLLALPTVDSQKGFGVQLRVAENLTMLKYASIQNALLYTNARGERRIRVSTVCLPVTSNIGDLFKYADSKAIVSLISKMAVEKAFSAKLSHAREALWNKCTDIVSSYQLLTNNMSGQLVLPETMQQLPLHILGLVKHTAFRGGTDVRIDERAYHLSLLRTLDCEATIKYIHPRLYALRSIEGAVGTVGEDGKVIMPPLSQLSSEHLDRSGVFLLDDGQYLLLWVGKAVVSEFLIQLFGLPSLYTADNSWQQLRRFDTELSRRVWAIIDQIRSETTVFQRLHIVREGDPMEYKFFGHFIMDRAKSLPSYYEFLVQLQKSVQERAKK